MKTYVLDSFALIAFYQDEEGADKVADYLNQSVKRQIQLLMSVINWGEVYYTMAKTKGEAKGEEAIGLIEKFYIHVVGVDKDFVLKAAYIKSKYNLSYADCFACALATNNKASIITADKEFKQIEELAQVIWIK